MSEPKRCRFEEIIPTQEPEPKIESLGYSECLQVGSKVYVIGCLPVYRKHVAIFDFQENSWSVADTQGQEQPHVWGHVSFIFNDRLYLHGGTSRTFRVAADLFFLDLVTLEWTQCITSVERPTARCGHRGEYLERLREFVIFGGGNAKGRYFGDLWTLSVETLEWNLVKAKGEAPTERAGLSSCAVGEIVYIYGGQSYGPGEGKKDDLHVLDCRHTRFVWSALTSLGLFRYSASLTYWKGEFLVLGGTNRTGHIPSDLYILQPPGYKPVKAHRVADSTAYTGCGHTVITTSTDLYVFDGTRESFNPLKLTLL